VTDSHHLNL